MIRQFNDIYYEYLDGNLVCDNRTINVNDIKSVNIVASESPNNSDTDNNVYLVKINSKNGSLFRVSRTSNEHLAVETLKDICKILQQHGDFMQFGSSVINMECVKRSSISEDKKIVNAIFKDNEELEIVNSPFPRVAIKCHDKLKRAIVNYKVKHTIM